MQLVENAFPPWFKPRPFKEKRGKWHIQPSPPVHPLQWPENPCGRLPSVMRIRLCALPILLLFTCLEAAELCAQPASLPHLEKRGAATQLIVDGKPFLMLSGELHNSSSSSLEYMKLLWPRQICSAPGTGR